MRKFALLLSASVFMFFMPNATMADVSKISPRLSNVIQQSSATVHTCWIYLNESAFEQQVNLSERALQRRAKADPINYLIEENDYPIKDEVLAEIKSTGVSIRNVSRWFKAVSVIADVEQIQQLSNMKQVQKIDLVKTMIRERPEEIESSKITPRKLGLSYDDYGLALFQNEFASAIALHNAGLTGAGVRLAILDSGFEPGHPAFDSANIVGSYDFINQVIPVDQFNCPEQFQSYRQSFHGTFVASIIAANDPGNMIGVAPGVELLLAKTEITCSGIEIQAEEDNWIAAAEWADSAGADIITSSLGYHTFQDSGSYDQSDLDGSTALITIAADIAFSKNILVVNSAGNERLSSWGTIVAPADGHNVIAVGSLSPSNTLSGFSSPGPSADGRIKPDIVSLGQFVYGAYDQGGYTSGQGTSFATPLVAGSAALAFELDPNLTAINLRQQIFKTASQYDAPDNNFGYGRFSAVKSAFITHLDLPEKVRLFLGQTKEILIQDLGNSPEIATISVINLPSSASFTDSGNGHALLTITGDPQNPSSFEIGFIIAISYFTDTTYLIIETLARSSEFAWPAPNPFAESVRIMAVVPPGEVLEISIFSSSGEKVWQTVNQSFVSADDSIRVIEWDGKNLARREVASGVYLVYIRSGNRAQSLKLLKMD